MRIRNLAIITALSSALLGPVTAYAADDVASAGPASFTTQLQEAREALASRNTATIGREERIEAGKHIAMAESLWNNGAAARAQQFLNFGRGKLGLRGASPDVAVAERIDEQFTSVR